MKRQLSLSARPKSLDDLVGQTNLVKRLRKGIKRSVPKGWLFCGPKGAGKTSIARIIALSLQCSHQEKFGQPCLACRKNKANLPIYELNCAKIRGVEDLEKYLRGAEYEVLGKGKRKVFILDEAHMLSTHAQNLLLGPTEDDTNNAVWILCSTRPDKIIETVRSRLKVRTLRALHRDDVLVLVERLLTKSKSDLKPDDLCDALVENSIVSGRLIAQAVESYIDGASAEEAADVDSSTEISSKALCRAVVKGLWEDVTVLLKKSSASDVRALRASVIGYLRVVLLESSQIDDRTKAVAEAIKRLSYVGLAEDVNQMGALAAELHSLCALFGEYSL